MPTEKTSMDTNPHSGSEASQDPVSAYCTRLNLVDPVDSDAFWAALGDRFGSLAERLRERFQAATEAEDEASRRERVQAVYELKNVDFVLSLAVTSQFRGVVLRNLMRWLARERRPGVRRVLDVGCDGGVLTCFLASLYPEAEVIGIDVNRSALRRAQELRNRLGLTNVSFDQVDGRRIAEGVAGGPCDLVVAVNVFEYLLDFPAAAGYFSVTEAERIPVSAETVEVLETIAGVLRIGSGTLVAVEQFASDAQQWWFLRALGTAGLSIDWDRFGQIRYQTDPTGGGVPLVTAVRRGQHVPPSLDDLLAATLVPHLETSREGVEFRQELAEALFRGLGPHEFVRGFEALYPTDPPVVERFELWQAGPLLLLFRSTSDGVRRLYLRSALRLAAVSADVEKQARVVESTYGARVRHYTTLAERTMSAAG